MSKVILFSMVLCAGGIPLVWGNAEVRTAESMNERPAAQEKTKVPVRSDIHDPVLQVSRETSKTARQQWRSALRAHLMQAEAAAGRVLSPAEMALAEAGFIRTHFEDYVAMEALQQIYREQLVTWTHSHETFVPGEEEVLTNEEARDRSLSKEDHAELQALRKVSLELLELEARSEAQLQAASTQPTE